MGRRKIYDDRNKYITEWTKLNRERISLKITKSDKAAIQGFAKHLNVSVTSLIMTAVREYTDRVYENADEPTKHDIDNDIEEFVIKQNEKNENREKKETPPTH